MNVEYFLNRSKKAKRISISIRPKTGVVLTVPFAQNPKMGIEFLQKKINWVKKKLKILEQFPRNVVPTSNRKDFLLRKGRARELALKKVSEWNLKYGFRPGRVAIKNSKTRWGSCSKKGNLNFHYRILDLPENLLDYLVVHELCHLKELNHSRKFWDLVGREIPEYKTIRKSLREYKIL